MNRDKTVDCLKGYACFLVVLGHVILGIRNMGGGKLPTLAYPIEQFIWSYHVPIFFFCSGYVFKINGGWRRSSSRFDFIMHKLLNLGVPYLFFSMVYILLNSLIPGTNSKFSVSDIFKLWNTPIAQYWYLYALFMLFLLFTVLAKRLTNIQITILLICVRYLCMMFSFTIPLIGLAISNSVSFGLGASLRDIKILENRKVLAGGVGIVHICLFVVAFMFDWFDYSIVGDLFRGFGVIASVMIISCICKIGFLKRVLLFINKYSFPIFLLHTIFTAGIRIVLKKVGIDSYFVQFICGMAIGIGAPTIVYYIGSKWWLIDFLFYPSKILEQIKK